MSAVTIPDMVRIIEHHNLVAVPVDIQGDGSVLAADIEALITTKTRAVLVAHLFGSRMDFDGIAIAAKRKGLVVFEDCAEAFCGRQFTGHDQADVSMFSFGLIKTATAFGGGILTIRDPSILAAAKSIQAQYRPQASSKYWTRVAKYCIFKVLTDDPYAYGVFLVVLYFLHLNHHTLIRKLSRSFDPNTLMLQIRQRPSAPLLQLLRHRIFTFEPTQLRARQGKVAYLSSLLPEEVRPIGFGSKHHVYWLCPVRVRRPEMLLESLYRAGFDVADGGTSLAVVSSEHYNAPIYARRMMKSVVYLPMDHEYARKQIRRLAELIVSHLEAYKI